MRKNRTISAGVAVLSGRNFTFVTGVIHHSMLIETMGLTGIDSKCVVSVSMPGNDGSPRYQMVIDQ